MKIQRYYLFPWNVYIIVTKPFFNFIDNAAYRFHYTMQQWEFLYHFIHFTVRLFSRNTSADVIESTLGVLHNSEKPKISKNTRKKGGKHNFRFYDVTSGDANGHVTSNSHVGHAQWYILYYYYSKKKPRDHFRSRDFQFGSRHFRSGPLPVSPPRSTSNTTLAVLIYYWTRTNKTINTTLKTKKRSNTHPTMKDRYIYTHKTKV